MSNEQTIDVTLSILGEPSTPARATLLHRTTGARVGRAVGLLLAAWAAALACIFIPIAHFVLVPSFAALGVVLAVVRLRDGTSLVKVVGVCPRCKVERALPTSGRYQPERQVHCESCGSQLALHAA